MLGATPAAGRLFRHGDDVPGVAQTVVLSYGYWQRRFAGDPDVVGQSIAIENEPHTIVGVVSTGFPLSGSLFASAPIDVYLPLAVDGNEDIGGFMAVVGRLRPGVTAEQARAELASRQAALSVGKWQWMTVLGQLVTPLPALVTREARSPVLLLLAGAGGVLLLACANLVNLLLVRASGRRREMQLRIALGATMRQVLAQMTIESAVLVSASGLVGVWLTVAVLEVLRRAEWVSIARFGDLHVGGADDRVCLGAVRDYHGRVRHRGGAAVAAAGHDRRAAATCRRHGRSTQRLRAATGTGRSSRRRDRSHRCRRTAAYAASRSWSTSIPGSILVARSRSGSIRQDASRVRPGCHFSSGSSRAFARYLLSNQPR